MKDSQGREISIARLDMLTDDEVQQLKDDSWDDFCWQSGNQYARMVHEFCVIEQDKRIRATEAQQVKVAKLIAIQDAQIREMEAKMSFWKEDKKRVKVVKVPKETPGFGPSGERLRGRMREQKTGTA